MKLTAKQEKFAQLLAEGRTQADAYRGAYAAAHDGSTLVRYDHKVDSWQLGRIIRPLSWTRASMAAAAILALVAWSISWGVFDLALGVDYVALWGGTAPAAAPSAAPIPAGPVGLDVSLLTNVLEALETFLATHDIRPTLRKKAEIAAFLVSARMHHCQLYKAKPMEQAQSVDMSLVGERIPPRPRSLCLRTCFLLLRNSKIRQSAARRIPEVSGKCSRHDRSSCAAKSCTRLCKNVLTSSASMHYFPPRGVHHDGGVGDVADAVAQRRPRPGCGGVVA